MPQRLRHDAYGRPLPELADARQEVLLEKEQNVEQCRLIQRLLEHYYAELLRRGIHAEVTLGFAVQNGIIQREVCIAVTREWGRG